MKKIKLTIASLLIAGFSYSQAKDTICSMVAGNIHFKFNYYTSEIIQDIQPVKDVKIKLKNKQVLVLDLYDNCECVEYNISEKIKNITTTNFLGLQKTTTINSSDTTLLFNGNKIKRVIIKQPIRNEEI
jgi:hypothetical protein|tara:strand:- start:785 stop:1171 length:387 start_codon:yes stop_codon:yes gene_type:complete